MSVVESSQSLARSLAVLAAVLLLVALASRARRLPLNRTAGIRLPSTMRSDAAWRAGNAAGSGPLAVAGLVDAGCAALLWLFASRPAATPVLCTIATVATLVGIGFAASRARKAALVADDSR